MTSKIRSDVTVLNNLIETGKFCKVQFVKKDGTIGVVHGRTGVHRHTKSGRVENKQGYITFWDCVKGYRSIKRDKILTVNGLHLRVAHSFGKVSLSKVNQGV